MFGFFSHCFACVLFVCFFLFVTLVSLALVGMSFPDSLLR